MTSFIIKAHERRLIPESWNQDTECAFCRIIRGEGRAFKVYEDELVVAVLDILPLREGHTLVIPKTHYSRVSELPETYAAATGVAVSKVANALAQALGNTALNVVCNQEYAQAVPHVHYHIIPAPRFDSPPLVSDKVDRVMKPLTQKEMHKAEFESRSELDDDEATELLQRIHARL
ncbi:HIT-like protein [Cristinia sonorae]|uniref:HIT-like protein n=1 Tax=Cristinia sonorae TaxID=1940300 RepID=A0A8K0UVD5_9AGAR|nr:HIT-like protein [Cristinia sonorae]